MMADMVNVAHLKRRREKDKANRFTQQPQTPRERHGAEAGSSSSSSPVATVKTVNLIDHSIESIIRDNKRMHHQMTKMSIEQQGTQRPAQRLRVPASAPCTLNAMSPPRVTLSLR